MAVSDQITPPESGFDLLQDPERLARAFERLNQLYKLRAQITTPPTLGVASIVFSAEGALLPIPIQIPYQIPATDGTSAGNAATLNSLLAGLRLVKLLPS